MKFVVKEKNGERLSKKEYDMQYAKEKIQQVKLTLNRETDADLVEWISRQDNKQGYLKRLIREDMERRKAGEK